MLWHDFSFGTAGFVHPEAWGINWFVYGGDHAHEAQVWCRHTFGMLSIFIHLYRVFFFKKMSVSFGFAEGMRDWLVRKYGERERMGKRREKNR